MYATISRPHRFRQVTLVLCFMLLAMTLAACNRSQPAQPSNNAPNAPGQPAGPQNANLAGQFGTPFESAYLTSDYEGALPTTMQLTLGTLKLEEGDHPLTPAQASKLLPLWQAAQSSAITSATERNAIYKSVENAMDPAQLNDIVAMQLTFTDMTEWATANGIEIPQGGGQFGQGRQGGAGGAGAAGENSPFAALTDEQRAELRNLSPEERTARLRELGIEVPAGGFGGGQAGGGQTGGGTGNGQAGGRNPQRGGRFNVLMEPLIQLLTTRVAE